MLEMRIGEIRAFRCVEANWEICLRCGDCAFDGDESACLASAHVLGNCWERGRNDERYVNFVSVDSNEIIRERIVESIDKWSKNNDDRLLPIESAGGDCRIGFKARYWKELLLELLQVENQPKGAMNDEVQSDLQDS